MANNDQLHVVNNCINYYVLLRGFYFFGFVSLQNECKCCNNKMAKKY